MLPQIYNFKFRILTLFAYLYMFKFKGRIVNMFSEEMQIEIYDPKEKLSERVTVEQISDNVFKVLENAIFNQNLTFNTEFETRINDIGQYEVINILKVSDFVTKRFMLSSEYKESEYRLLGDEVMKIGGFWQIDFGSIATINIPKEYETYIEEIFKVFNLKPE